MEPMERQAILTELVTQMESNDSWCGETHLQKCTYFLQQLCKVPLDFKFILYLYGPFSFELRDEITGMRADRFLQIQVRPGPYGPSLRTDDRANILREQFIQSIEPHRHAIEFVARNFSNRKVTELERLATTFFVLDEMKEQEDRVPQVVRELKPHVSPVDAEKALEVIKKLRDEAPQGPFATV